MTRPFLHRPARALPLAAALVLACLASALAQGTPEQREACAPDAIKLCQDTIPDEGRTAACMRTHLAELSSACRTVFLDAKGGKPAAAEPRARRTAKAPDDEETTRETTPRGRAHRQRTARLAPSDDDVLGDGPVLPSANLPNDRETRSDARRARVVMRRLCRGDVLDADTCAFTNRMIDLAR